MLEVKNLSYSSIIQNVSLHFKPGKLYGILGPNGAGKTTLLKLLSGIWPATSGKVIWNKKNLHTQERHEVSQVVTLVPQNPLTPFPYTVEEMVAMGRYPATCSQEKITEALTLVDAEYLRHRPITELSGGERQRVYIARSIAKDAPILLLDEPTSSLDIHHQLKIWKLLREITRQGKIVIATIHQIKAAEKFCDEITILKQGKLAAHGHYDQVMTPALMSDVFNMQPSDSLFW